MIVEVARKCAFLQAAVAKYDETARDAIRRYDPNHMFFGDKINANANTNANANANSCS